MIEIQGAPPSAPSPGDAFRVTLTESLSDANLPVRSVSQNVTSRGSFVPGNAKPSARDSFDRPGETGASAASDGVPASTEKQSSAIKMPELFLPTMGQRVNSAAVPGEVTASLASGSKRVAGQVAQERDDDPVSAESTSQSLQTSTQLKNVPVAPSKVQRTPRMLAKAPLQARPGTGEDTVSGVQRSERQQSNVASIAQISDSGGKLKEVRTVDSASAAQIDLVSAATPRGAALPARIDATTGAGPSAALQNATPKSVRPVPAKDSRNVTLESSPVNTTDREPIARLKHATPAPSDPDAAATKAPLQGVERQSASQSASRYEDSTRSTAEVRMMPKQESIMPTRATPQWNVAMPHEVSQSAVMEDGQVGTTDAAKTGKAVTGRLVQDAATSNAATMKFTEALSSTAGPDAVAGPPAAIHQPTVVEKSSGATSAPDGGSKGASETKTQTAAAGAPVSVPSADDAASSLAGQTQRPIVGQEHLPFLDTVGSRNAPNQPPVEQPRDGKAKQLVDDPVVAGPVSQSHLTETAVGVTASVVSDGTSVHPSADSSANQARDAAASATSVVAQSPVPVPAHGMAQLGVPIAGEAVSSSVAHHEVAGVASGNGVVTAGMNFSSVAWNATAAAEPHRTLVATPTTLEVGVPNGTQGWLKIRAEVGGQGEVTASLAAGSSSGQQALHSQLPALNAYLHNEQMAVTTTVAEKSFAFGASSQGATLADASGGSSLLNGQEQRDGRSRELPQQPADARDSDAAMSYDIRGAINAAAAAQPLAGLSESGRWLNVRA